MTPNNKPGCLASLLNLLRGDKQPEAYPYRLRDDLLSPAELSFYHVLSSVAGSQATVCVKIRMSDVLYVSRPHENIGHRNRIDRRHIDFLLCDPATMKPLVALELDDSSRQRRDRQARDAFLDKALRAAGLPLLRVPVRRQYDPRQVAAQVEPFLSGRAATPAPAIEPEAASDAGTGEPATPLCPKCGIPMVLRTGTRGPARRPAVLWLRQLSQVQGDQASRRNLTHPPPWRAVEPICPAPRLLHNDRPARL